MTAIKESWWVCGLHFPPREPWITFSGRHSSYFSRRIKNSIEKTAKTGEAVHNAPATMVLGSDNPKNVRFEISTWKAGDVVFLRIDDFLS